MIVQVFTWEMVWVALGLLVIVVAGAEWWSRR